MLQICISSRPSYKSIVARSSDLLAPKIYFIQTLYSGFKLFFQESNRPLPGQRCRLRVIAVGLGLWDILLESEQDRLWQNYVEANMQSEGALIRVLMNLVPSFLLLFYWQKWKPRFPGGQFWIWMAIASIVSVLLVNFASTAVDRVALYLTPVQVAVFSRLPFMIKRQADPEMVTLFILLGYASVLYVWLNYATHARFWIPYQNSLFLN